MYGKLCRALLLLLLGLSLPAAAEDFGIVYEPPPGWIALASDPGRAFYAPDLPAGGILQVAVWPADRLDGDSFRTWFGRQVAASGFPAPEANEAQEGSTRGLQILELRRSVSDATAGSLSIRFYGFSSDARAGIAVMMTNRTELTDGLRTAVQTFFDSLKFTSAEP